MHLHPCVHKCVVSGGGTARTVYFVAKQETNPDGETVYWWPRDAGEFEGDEYLDSPYQYTDPLTANRIAAELFGETPARRFTLWLHRLTGKILGLAQ